MVVEEDHSFANNGINLNGTHPSIVNLNPVPLRPVAATSFASPEMIKVESAPIIVQQNPMPRAARLPNNIIRTKPREAQPEERENSSACKPSVILVD